VTRREDPRAWLESKRVVVLGPELDLRLAILAPALTDELEPVTGVIESVADLADAVVDLAKQVPATGARQLISIEARRRLGKALHVC
jgi:hypothetical protein